jgi:hypothetical protein
MRHRKPAPPPGRVDLESERKLLITIEPVLLSGASRSLIAGASRRARPELVEGTRHRARRDEILNPFRAIVSPSLALRPKTPSYYFRFARASRNDCRISTAATWSMICRRARRSVAPRRPRPLSSSS